MISLLDPPSERPTSNWAQSSSFWANRLKFWVTCAKLKALCCQTHTLSPRFADVALSGSHVTRGCHVSPPGHAFFDKANRGVPRGKGVGHRTSHPTQLVSTQPCQKNNPQIPKTDSTSHFLFFHLRLAVRIRTGVLGTCEPLRADRGLLGGTQGSKGTPWT